jgi:hypothetical protein
MYELSSCLWVPRAEFSDATRKQLTVKVFRLDGSHETVQAFRTDRRGYIGIPRAFAMKSIAISGYTDKRSSGSAVSFRKEVSLRDYQVPFVAAMMAATELHTDFIAEAATGKGKTVCALDVIQRRGRTAFVVVDQDNLKDQWVERATEHLGMRPDEIGIVQGDRADWQGKSLVICMIQTLVQRTFSREFYAAAGTVVFDESHTTGAVTFSQVLMQFSAEVRFGVSATPDRTDALSRVIEHNLGGVQAALYDKPEPSLVYVAESCGVYSYSCNAAKMSGRYLNEIASDGLRNLKIAESVMWLYGTGRDVLVIGDRVGHLCSLMALCKTMGLPEEHAGLYAKSREVYQYEKDPRPSRKPEGYVRGTEYTPLRFACVQKTIKKPELQRVKESARVIFATYGIMAKGVDIPRLSGGVDATPRAAATQVHGRTLRVAPGKLTPIWITFEDCNSFRSLHQLHERLSDYTNSNAEVFIWNPRKGRKRMEVRTYQSELKSRIRDLRQSQTTMRLDGNNTLTIPSMQISSDD